MNNQYNFKNSINYNYNDYSCLKSKIKEQKLSKNVDMNNTQYKIKSFFRKIK